MPMGYRIGSWDEPPEDGTGEPEPTSVTVAAVFPYHFTRPSPRRHRGRGRWAEKQDTKLLLRQLGKSKKKIPATPPVHHYAGPASDLSFTQASDLRLIPDRNHPAKDLGPWYLQDRFVWILAEYGLEDPQARQL